MNRKDFIRNTVGFSAGSILLGSKSVPKNYRRQSNNITASISRVNDARVTELLKRTADLSSSNSARGKSGFILSLSAAFCSEYSEYYRSDDLIDPLQNVAQSMLDTQNADGTWSGGNINSPPDSGFSIEQLFRAQGVLIQDGSSSTESLRETLKETMLNTCEALIVGGVHTPNHRWAISAALAGTNSLYPDQRYVDRLENWIGEGFGQDEDGEHPERSRNYDSAVNNPSLLDVAIYQNKPDIFEVVRKNLELTLYLLEPNGEVETVASRRQDHARSFMIHRYYLPYRYMAIHDQNPQFATIARYIEENHMDTLGEHLADFLLHSELTKDLPNSKPLNDNFVKHLKKTQLVRIRRGNTTASIFGGTDWYLGLGAWSGISHNPTFFKYRKGGAILESLRMAPAFFSTGYFRSNGLIASGNNQYNLQEERHVPYHLPLPEHLRERDGEYEMTPDGRFYSKMSFDQRPKHYVNLRTQVAMKELSNSQGYELEFLINETDDVAITLELCFRKGGTLSGVIPSNSDEKDTFFLNEGQGTYKVGDDVITFGPGMHKHTRIRRLSNEQYSVHNGEVSTLDGYLVYITGVTPFRYTLRFS